MKKNNKHKIAGGLMLFALLLTIAFGMPATAQAVNEDEYVMTSCTSSDVGATYEYKYDANGRVIEKIEKKKINAAVSEETSTKYTNKYKYDKNGNLIVVNRYEQGKFYEKEVYDKKGNLVSAKRSVLITYGHIPFLCQRQDTGTMAREDVVKETYKKGKLVSAKWYTKGKLTKKETYDKKGNLLVEEFLDKTWKNTYKNTYKKGKLSKTVKKEYTGDGKEYGEYRTLVHTYYTSDYRAGQVKTLKVKYDGGWESKYVYTYKQDPVSKKISECTQKEKSEVIFTEKYTYAKLSDLIN